MSGMYECTIADSHARQLNYPNVPVIIHKKLQSHSWLSLKLVLVFIGTESIADGHGKAWIVKIFLL